MNQSELETKQVTRSSAGKRVDARHDWLIGFAPDWLKK